MFLGWWIFICAAVLLWFSETAMQSALSAAQVFISSVMPALFPMMVLCRLLPPNRGGVIGAAAFACLSGSPASAQRAASLSLTSIQLEKLLCASGLMSPMFFTGTLTQWCQSREMGLRLLLVHWLSAWLTAWIWRPARQTTAAAPADGAARVTLVSAISQSASALLGVLGAMMLFSILAGVLKQALALMVPGWTQSHAPFLAIVWAVLEIGSGAKAVIDAFPSPPGALLCALCSFGGLSLWLQNLLFLSEKIRPAKLLCMRMLHGALAYGVFRLLSFL